MALSNEVTRFKQRLRDKGAAEDVLKVCAVVEANLGEIAQTAHAGGQRTRVIAPMIREGMTKPLPMQTISSVKDAGTPLMRYRVKSTERKAGS